KLRASICLVIYGPFERDFTGPSDAFQGLGLDLNREAPLAEFGKEGIRLEVLLGGPDTRSQWPAQYLLHSNRHVHGSAGVGVIVVERVGMADHTAGDSAAFPVTGAVADGKVNLVNF